MAFHHHCDHYRLPWFIRTVIVYNCEKKQRIKHQKGAGGYSIPGYISCYKGLPEVGIARWCGGFTCCLLAGEWLAQGLCFSYSDRLVVFLYASICNLCHRFVDGTVPI